MRNLRTFSLVKALLFLMLSFSLTGFWGCEKNESNYLEDSPYLKIDGDLYNPETLINPNNKAVFIEASTRIKKYLKVENEKLFLTINSGSEINVSSEIFEYISSNYELTNRKIEDGTVNVYLDKKGNISVSKRMTKFLGISRLKSGNVESSGEKIDLHNKTPQEILEILIEFANGDNNGSLGDYFNLESINWQTNGMGDASIRGYGKINGRTVSYYMANACYWTEDNDCDFNNIGSYNGNSNWDWVRNIDGLPIVSIHYF